MINQENVQSKKCLVGEMSGQGIILSENCPVGEIRVGNCLSGSCQSGNFPVRELFEYQYFQEV